MFLMVNNELALIVLQSWNITQHCANSNRASHIKNHYRSTDSDGVRTHFQSLHSIVTIVTGLNSWPCIYKKHDKYISRQPGLNLLQMYVLRTVYTVRLQLLFAIQIQFTCSYTYVNYIDINLSEAPSKLNFVNKAVL